MNFKPPSPLATACKTYLKTDYTFEHKDMQKTKYK